MFVLRRPCTNDFTIARTQPVAGVQLTIGLILQHDEAPLCGLRHRFGPTVCIKLGEYRSDMKLDGVE